MLLWPQGIDEPPDGVIFAIAAAIYAVFGLVCAVLAPGRGRSALAWFFIGVIGNCLGVILLLLLPNLKVEAERERRREEENRKLRELLRKERQVADQRSAAHDDRLAAHDRALGLDTRPPELLPSDGDSAGAAPPALPAAEWYYAVGGVRHGPTSAARLRELRRSGRVDDRTLVWREGMPDWVAITDAGELDTGGT